MNPLRLLSSITLSTGPFLAMALSALGCAGDPGEATDDQQPLADEETSVTAQAIVPDPANVATSGYCTYNYTWNGTAARVYHPPNGDCNASVYSPLVVLLHGTGYDYTEYNDLLRHLARNGFIAVSIDVLANSTSPADHAAGADAAWAFVEDFLWSTWSKRFYIDPSSVALIGHSRGGATVRYLADKLASDPIFDVRSVVSLAPTGGDNGFATGLKTIGYMSLYGTRDPDVSPSNPYRQYDRAGNENSHFDPTWQNDALYKSMKLINNADHASFSDRGLPNYLALTRGYVLSFLKAHNVDDVTWYEDYIRGDAVPNGSSTLVVSQYSDGWLRRVIDHFDDGTLGASTIGDAVFLSGAPTASVIDLGTNPLLYSHQTRALHIEAASEGTYIRWAIPSGKRDTSTFKWLSFRMGQVSGAPADDLVVQIRNGVTWSPEIRVADHGAIVQPIDMCTTGAIFACQQFTTLGHMGTVRVPLDAFGAHDDVNFVRVTFRGDSLSKKFILDNLEFSEFILKP